MTIQTKKRENSVTNYKEVFIFWQTKSLREIQEILNSRNIISPITGKGYSPMGVAYMAWDYACGNIDESLGIVNEYRRANGIDPLEKDDWVTHLRGRARIYLSRRKIKRYGLD